MKKSINISKKLIGSAIAISMAASMTTQVSAAKADLNQIFVDTVANSADHKCGAGKCGSGKCGAKDSKKTETPKK